MRGISLIEYTAPSSPSSPGLTCTGFWGAPVAEPALSAISTRLSEVEASKIKSRGGQAAGCGSGKETPLSAMAYRIATAIAIEHGILHNIISLYAIVLHIAIAQASPVFPEAFRRLPAERTRQRPWSNLYQFKVTEHSSISHISIRNGEFIVHDDPAQLGNAFHPSSTVYA